MARRVRSEDNKEKSNESSEFIEIAPLNFDVDNSVRKDFSSVPISEVDIPKVAYMIVNQQIELEIKPLKDFPQWQFLSQSELERKTIQITYCSPERFKSDLGSFGINSERFLILCFWVFNL